MGDPHEIEDLAALRRVIGEPIPGLGLKNQSTISDEAREYIEHSPFLVLATSDAEGRLDASPKGDGPGFCLIEDERTLVIPDRPGNKLVYGLQNILANPRVGVIFMLPGTPETVRVNGIATLTADPDLLARLAARGKPAVLAIRIQVEECFHHCAKAFLRSQLWKRPRSGRSSATTSPRNSTRRSRTTTAPISDRTRARLAARGSARRSRARAALRASAR
ncbi:MAG: pyridoxamine 5'-phosphate oxidase family protein [Deltaproteobacteria bacterium]|nr:MAG: pyridoxamine 5'-phosphate oxidase family protein [Deltaproteobacteria bacterium]